MGHYPASYRITLQQRLGACTLQLNDDLHEEVGFTGRHSTPLSQGLEPSFPAFTGYGLPDAFLTIAGRR